SMRMGRFVRRPSASSVAVALSAAALFVALGGAAPAVHVKLGKNDVKAKNIKKNAVTPPKIKDDSVGSTELRADTASRGKVADDTLTGADIDESTLSGVKASSLEGVDLIKAKTVQLQAPPGSGASEDLFTIGRVRLTAGCVFDSPTQLRAQISPVVDSTGA